MEWKELTGRARGYAYAALSIRIGAVDLLISQLSPAVSGTEIKEEEEK